MDNENSRSTAEIVAIENQLNGIEKYAMHYLEEENAEFALTQLLQAEVRYSW